MASPGNLTRPRDGNAPQSGADCDLDLLRLFLTDLELLLLVDGVDDRVVELVASADADRPGDNQPSERQRPRSRSGSRPRGGYPVTSEPTDAATGRSAPIAAASGSSISDACAAPAASVACSTALRSTGVIPLGTHTITCVRVPRLPSTRRMKCRSICSVV